MTVETIPHNAPTARNEELRAWASQLYALISSGHDRLEFNIDSRGPALTEFGADGKRRPVQVGDNANGTAVPAWQPARELREGGAIVARRFNSFVLERHLAGRYSVAPAAAGWVQWGALDIDAHRRSGESELEARRRALRVLGGVWRALNCSAERHPIVLRSPGGGFHVWFPLTRGPNSLNSEHTWPARAVRGWFERHWAEAGLELASGTLEVFPSGRRLRAPCGVGMVLLQATQPDDPDALGLMPWPDTMRDVRVDWRGGREAPPARRVVPMVRAFVAQWEAQRRTLADWLGRAETSWDPAWGPLVWRGAPSEPADDLAPSAEKKPGEISSVEDCRSQQSDDVLARPMAGVPRGEAGKPAGGAGKPERSRARKRSGPAPIADAFIASPAPEVDVPVVPAGDALVRGRAFKTKVAKLLLEGITQASTRHDAVLTLAFYWAATCGLEVEQALARLDAWSRAHPHTGSRLASRPRVLLATCLQEARHYIEHYAAKWPFRGRGDGGGLGTLTPADHAVLDTVDARVRGEVATILAWLAGRADGAGRIGEPVQIASGLLGRLCGDRRIEEAGERRRATTIAIAELERLGVLTMACQYQVGRRGRMWSCWYQFGSGALPRSVELSATTWAELVPQPNGIALAPALAVATPSKSPQEASSAPMVTVRVLGERTVPEGLLRVLSDGARGVPRTLLVLAPDVVKSTVELGARAPWFVRPFQRAFTPAELRTADFATLIPFPDVDARRRMTRRARLALGGGGLAPVISLAVRSEADSPLASGLASAHAHAHEPARLESNASEDAPLAPMAVRPEAEATAEAGGEEAEMAVGAETETGVATAELPRDLADAIESAWRAFERRGRDP